MEISTWQVISYELGQTSYNPYTISTLLDRLGNCRKEGLALVEYLVGEVNIVQERVKIANIKTQSSKSPF